MGSKPVVFQRGRDFITLRKIALPLLAVAFLASCDEQGNFAFPTAARAPAQSTEATGPLVERDVEAPEIFSVTDDGLWDGRPSLGGVWVAHPDVNEPERVIIRNQANGKFVVGALFRRERNIPGPSLQISSDAAASLGILAGAPTQLNVTALTKVTEPAAQDVATPSEPSDTATTETGTIDDAPAVATSTLDPVTAAAGAAIDAATPAPAPAIPAQASNLAKPFIQIGIFSIEANAERAAKQMRGAGLAPTVKQSEINGKTFWRVVVGPAATTAERSKILSAIKAEGYTDAYAVSG